MSLRLENGLKKNIKYDITYTGLNKITAIETYESKRGVCHHKTKII